MNNMTAPSPLLSDDGAALVRRVGMILLGLAGLVAARFLRNPRLVGLIGPLWRRLTHVAGRVGRAMARTDRTRTVRVRGVHGARAAGGFVLCHDSPLVGWPIHSRGGEALQGLQARLGQAPGGFHTLRTSRGIFGHV